MRVALVHSFYDAGQPSGENRVVLDQARILQESGHEVSIIRRDTDKLVSTFYGVKTAINVALGRGFDPSIELHQFRPDIVHIHNLFPNFGIDWIEKWPGAKVLSVHNYRAVCSNGLFYREGNVCTECAIKGTHRAIVHACYRGSRLATTPVAVSRGRYREKVLRSVDAIVTTSAFSDAVFHEFIDVDAVTDVIPNFGPENLVEPPKEYERTNWVAFGRFASEKGFVELLNEWPPGESLTLIGDGPLRNELEFSASNKDVVVGETVGRDMMRDLLAHSTALIFPSRWFESDPQVVVEAMRLGTPVVARDGSAVAEMIRETGSGRTYHDAEELAQALVTVREEWQCLSQAAYETFNERWTKSIWLKRIESLYSSILSSREP